MENCITSRLGWACLLPQIVVVLAGMSGATFAQTDSPAPETEQLESLVDTLEDLKGAKALLEELQ